MVSLLIALLALGWTPQPQREDHWALVAPEGNNFSVMMPQPVALVSREVRFQANLSMDEKVYEADDAGINYYVVSFKRTNPPGELVILHTFATMNKGFRYSLLHGIADSDSKIIAERQLTVGGRKVNEYEFQKAERKGVARTYETEARYYCFVVLGRTDQHLDASRFFDSVQLKAAKEMPRDVTMATITKRDVGEPTLGDLLWKATTPIDKNVVVVAGWLNTRVLNPQEATAERPAQFRGTRVMVTVQIVVDGEGKVISGKATEGDPLLYEVAVGAAVKARFKPLRIQNNPVRFQGYLIFDFARQVGQLQ